MDIRVALRIEPLRVAPGVLPTRWAPMTVESRLGLTKESATPVLTPASSIRSSQIRCIWPPSLTAKPQHLPNNVLPIYAFAVTIKKSAWAAALRSNV